MGSPAHQLLKGIREEKGVVDFDKFIGSIF